MLGQVRMSCSCEMVTRVVSHWGETFAPQHLFLPGNFTASVLKVAVTSEPQASSLCHLSLSSKDCRSWREMCLETASGFLSALSERPWLWSAAQMPSGGHQSLSFPWCDQSLCWDANHTWTLFYWLGFLLLVVGVLHVAWILILCVCVLHTLPNPPPLVAFFGGLLYKSPFIYSHTILYDFWVCRRVTQGTVFPIILKLFKIYTQAQARAHTHTYMYET